MLDREPHTVVGLSAYAVRHVQISKPKLHTQKNGIACHSALARLVAQLPHGTAVTFRKQHRVLLFLLYRVTHDTRPPNIMF